MSLHFVSAKIVADLRKMERRIRRFCTEPYTAKMLFVPCSTYVPGDITITARNAQVYARLVRMVKRIIPEVKIKFEHGYGWHYLDRTEYHSGNFAIIREPIS